MESSLEGEGLESGHSQPERVRQKFRAAALTPYLKM